MTDVRALVEKLLTAIGQTEEVHSTTGPISWKAVELNVAGKAGEVVGSFENAANARHAAWHDPLTEVRRCTLHRMIAHRCVEAIGDLDVSDYEVPRVLPEDPAERVVALAVGTLIDLAREYDRGTAGVS